MKTDQMCQWLLCRVHMFASVGYKKFRDWRTYPLMPQGCNRRTDPLMPQRCGRWTDPLMPQGCNKKDSGGCGISGKSNLCMWKIRIVLLWGQTYRFKKLRGVLTNCNIETWWILIQATFIKKLWRASEMAQWWSYLLPGLNIYMWLRYGSCDKEYVFVFERQLLTAYLKDRGV